MTYLAKTNVPLPISSANQASYQDGSSNNRPAQYNESNSGGSQKFKFSTAITQAAFTAPCRACRLHIPGTGGTLGAITIHDNAAGDTSGDVLFGPTTPSAGQIFDLQIPCALGISITTASATVGFLTFDAV